MRWKFARTLYALGLVLFVTNLASAQEYYHQLTVNDFKGTPRANGDNAVAYTNCSIDFKYHVHSENNVYQLTFDVRLNLEREKSWIDKKRIFGPQMLTRILNHEQGHYNIAYMEQQEILRIASRTRFDANYQAQASALFNRIHAKYEQLNINYDADTQHMLDNVQQHSWDVYFQKRIDYMPPIAKVGY